VRDREVTASSERKPRLVVFDLDGTLIDSIGDIASSANQSLVEAYGEEARLSSEVVRGFVGHGARQLIERCVGAASRPSSDVARIFERFLLIYGSRLTETTRLYPGMSAALAAIEASSRLAVLTNKPGVMSRTIMRDLGLADRFIAVIGGDDLKTKKPDPEGLFRIGAEAGVAPHETALVGDSAVDIQTARNAGALSVGALWGYDREGVLREKPDITVAHPRELTALVR
jgi:phosphoglycolate phosphatase